MFPVHKYLADKLALLYHLKQSLSRKLLNQIKGDRKKKESRQGKQNHHVVTSDGKEDNETESTSQQITYDENEEQLIFNYRVSHEQSDANLRNIFKQQQTRSMKG